MHQGGAGAEAAPAADRPLAAVAKGPGQQAPAPYHSGRRRGHVPPTVCNVTTPRLRVEGACLRLGQPEVVRRCRALLAGDTADPDFIITLGGTAAVRYLNDGQPDHQAYWLRVWGARGLLWAGPGSDTAVLRGALDDDHWRVREMVCKVVARHDIGDLLDGVAVLESDAVERVRTAAKRAAATIVDSKA